MNYKLIGIAGPARVGKDTAADFIMRELPLYSKISFADPIKEMLRTGLGLTQSQLYGNNKEEIDERYGCTPRHLMQTLGTEWGRDLISQDLWVNAVETHIENDLGDFIIPDVRFESEANMIRKKGILIHIKGNNKIGGNHSSEKGIYEDVSDIVVHNTDTLDKFHDTLAMMVSTELA